jgi:hypothetical protein
MLEVKEDSKKTRTMIIELEDEQFLQLKQLKKEYHLIWKNFLSYGVDYINEHKKEFDALKPKVKEEETNNDMDRNNEDGLEDNKGNNRVIESKENEQYY